MAPQLYGGPASLAYSRYASSTMRKAQPLSVPPAVSSTDVPSNSAIATKQQIAASLDESLMDLVTHNSDAQLAVAQGNALEEEVEKHTARFSRTVSSTVTTTRRLLELIRGAVQKADVSALKTVDELWTELEQLFEAANGTKEALPEFLEKQRNNMALYHASTMNETYRDSQAELNMQYKKVNLQHSLILEHQQAFEYYKANTATKLTELEDLQERVSRLTLEKGNLRDEIDRYAQLLEKDRGTRVNDSKTADALHEELKTLASSKKQLLAEVDGMQKTISDLQDTSRSTEKQISDHFRAEVKERTDLLAKETAKTANLTTLTNTLKDHESNAKMEIEKVKAESKLLTEKYTRMAAEHSQVFTKSKEHTQRIETLTADAERFRRENADLEARLKKLHELEKNEATLFKEKSDLLEKIGKISMELQAVKENYAKANNELSALTDRLEQAKKERDTLKTENKKFLSQQFSLQAEQVKTAQAVQAATKLENENIDMKATVAQLKATQTAPAAGGIRSTNKDIILLEENVQELKTQNATLQATLEEWMALAKRSYTEYKDMLPMYKQAEQLRTDVDQKDHEIKTLKVQLSAVKTSQSNGVGAGGDATYWKKKYDGLLASVGN